MAESFPPDERTQGFEPDTTSLGALSDDPTIAGIQERTASAIAPAQEWIFYLEAEKGKREQQAQEIQQSLAAMEGKGPTLERPKAPSWNPYESNSRTFALASTALLALSVAGPYFGKMGATTMLQSLNGALEGLYQGNKERFDREWKAYELKHREVVEEYNAANRNYWNIVNQKDKEHKEIMREINLFFQQIGIAKGKIVTSLQDANKEMNKAMAGKAALEERRLTREQKTATEGTQVTKEKKVYAKEHPKQKGETQEQFDARFIEYYNKLHPKGGKSSASALDLAPAPVSGVSANDPKLKLKTTTPSIGD